MSNNYSEFDQKQQTIFKQWLNGLLKTEVVTVEFTKSDGSLRTMQATLKENVLPKMKSTQTKNKKINDDVCVVWDIDQASWRSFRYDRLVSIKFTLE